MVLGTEFIERDQLNVAGKAPSAHTGSREKAV